MKTTIDQISSSLSVPLEAGMPEGEMPLSRIHLSWPSVNACTWDEVRVGTGGDMRSAKGTPVLRPSIPWQATQ